MMSEGARFEKSIQSMERSAKYWEDLALLPIDLAVGALASAIKGDNSAMPRRLGEFWEL